MTITLKGVSDTGPEWTNEDFLEHYFNGKGKGVTLRQVGHLVKVVAAYMNEAEENLKGQVADDARKNIGQSFVYHFDNTYGMRDVVYSLGTTTIGGGFFGTSILKNDIINIEGDFLFYQADEFTDIFGVGFEPPGSTIYPITDIWGGSLRGRVVKNRSQSRYKFN